MVARSGGSNPLSAPSGVDRLAAVAISQATGGCGKRCATRAARKVLPAPASPVISTPPEKRRLCRALSRRAPVRPGKSLCSPRPPTCGTRNAPEAPSAVQPSGPAPQWTGCGPAPATGPPYPASRICEPADRGIQHDGRGHHRGADVPRRPHRGRGGSAGDARRDRSVSDGRLPRGGRPRPCGARRRLRAHHAGRPRSRHATLRGGGAQPAAVPDHVPRWRRGTRTARAGGAGGSGRPPERSRPRRVRRVPSRRRRPRRDAEPPGPPGDAERGVGGGG